MLQTDRNVYKKSLESIWSTQSIFPSNKTELILDIWKYTYVVVLKTKIWPFYWRRILYYSISFQYPIDPLPEEMSISQQGFVGHLVH